MPRRRRPLRATNGSKVTAVDYETAGWPSAYEEFQFELANILPATDNAYLYLRVKAASVWNNSNSAYNWGVMIVGNSGTAGGDGASGPSAITSLVSLTRAGASQGLSTTAGSSGYTGTVRFRNPVDETAATRRVGFRSEGAHTQAGGGNVPARTVGIGEFASAALVQGVRFGAGTGQLASGSFKLYGRRR
jgi:hypothetical protein